MQKIDRDFIDFVIELYSKKNIFFILLTISLVIAGFTYHKNKDNYAFSIKLTIAKESSFIKMLSLSNFYRENIANPLGGLQGDESVIYSNLNSAKRTYETLKINVCETILTSSVDYKFIEGIAKDFKDSQFYDNSLKTTLGGISEDISSSIKHIPRSGGICSEVKVSGSYALTSFLKDNYNDKLNDYIRKEMFKRLSAIREGKIDFLEKLKSTIDNSDAEASIDERLKLFEKMPLDGVYIRYFTHYTSGMYKVVSLTFTLLLAIFLTLVLFVLSVILIDFKSQYTLRKLGSG
jgi:hypothetical protein